MFFGGSSEMKDVSIRGPMAERVSWMFKVFGGSDKIVDVSMRGPMAEREFCILIDLGGLRVS
jgi:hypothetical protein